jgi:CheY-like chemotaxis protein
MLADGEPEDVAAVQQEAAEAQLPLLTLTTAAAADLTAGVAAAVMPPTSEGRVLVVDDDDYLAEVLCAALERRGLDVERAPSQQAALDAVARLRPDLLVLDVGLAGGDGFGVVDDLRGQGLSELAPIVVYSVLELDPAERDRLQTGGTAFLTKGRDRVEDVVHDVVRLLAGKGASPSPMNQA